MLHILLQELRQAMISCAESLQYEASTLPAEQMRQEVLREQSTKKQQVQSRLDGGEEIDGSRRHLLPITQEELPGHHVPEHCRAHAERRQPPCCFFASAFIRLPSKPYAVLSSAAVGLQDQSAG